MSAKKCGAFYADADDVSGPCARASGHDGNHEDLRGDAWAQERTATAPPAVSPAEAKGRCKS